MSFWPPFLVGIAVGGVVTWRLNRRKHHRWTTLLNQELVPAATRANASGMNHDTSDRLEAQPGAVDTADDASREAASMPMASGDESESLTTAAVHDPLADIQGMEPFYARQLHEAGVSTVADLAALTPERLAELVALEEGAERLIDPQDWIAQARALTRDRVPPA